MGTPITPQMREVYLRCAYERGRWHLGIRDAVCTLVPSVGLWIYFEYHPWILLVGMIIAWASCYAAWYGRVWHVAIRTGWQAGWIPAITAWIAKDQGKMHMSNHHGWCLSWCNVACVLGGITASAWIIYRARHYRSSVDCAFIATLCCLLTASMVCQCVGLGSILAVAIGAGCGLTYTTLKQWQQVPMKQ